MALLIISVYSKEQIEFQSIIGIAQPMYQGFVCSFAVQAVIFAVQIYTF